MQLHSCREIKQHVSQVWTFISQFMKNSMCDQLNGQLNVAKSGTKSYTKKFIEEILAFKISTIINDK